MTTVRDNTGLTTPGQAELRLSDSYGNGLLSQDPDAQQMPIFPWCVFRKLAATKSDAMKHSTRRLMSSKTSSWTKMKWRNSSSRPHPKNPHCLCGDALKERALGKPFLLISRSICKLLMELIFSPSHICSGDSQPATRQSAHDRKTLGPWAAHRLPQLGRLASLKDSASDLRKDVPR